MEQDNFWAGDFGDKYSERNVGRVQNNLSMFVDILHGCEIDSILEFGAGTGENILALKELYPFAHFDAIEINESACDKLRDIDNVNVFWGSAFDAPILEGYDLVLSKGFLIHIHPDYIDKIYEKMYQATGKYLLLCEYYNPTLISVDYRGVKNRLWKRDFAGDMIDKYEMKLIEYGFVYHRDEFPQDDLTWFLLEKGDI